MDLETRDPAAAEELRRRNRRTMRLLVAVAVGLFVLSIVYVGVFRKP